MSICPYGCLYARDASAQQLGAQSRDCGVDINRAISVSIAELNKADYSMCHIISPVVFHMKTSFRQATVVGGNGLP